MIEIRAYYSGGFSAEMDKAAHDAAGRLSDFGGMWTETGERDLGWQTESEVEAHKIITRLKEIGLRVERHERVSMPGT